MTFKINMMKLPTTCSFCEEQAIEIIEFYFNNFFEDIYFGSKFFCREHIKEMKKLDRKESRRVLEGKRVL